MPRMAYTTRPLDASVEIAAPPERVWEVVSDVRRTGEWSPECRKVVVLGDGAVGVGTRFVGINRRGFLVWPTRSRVTAYDVGRRIEWRVLDNGALWSYDLEPAGPGATRLTSRRRTPHGVKDFAARFTELFLGGNPEHTVELEDGMRRSLGRIRELAER